MRTRRLLIAGGILLLLVLIGGLATFAALNAPNRARPEAVAALQSQPNVTVSRVPGEDWYVFTPQDTAPETGFILYPGGFVDPVAYAPVAQAIAQEGFLVVIDPMPLNLAVTGVEGADAIIAAFPEITSWGIGGHSLGGAMAAEYVKNNPDAISGLALWAAYPAENTDLSARSLVVVSVYGDADGVASVSDVTGAASRLPPDTRFVAIPGGNHTQFGSYGDGLQRGDAPAGVSREAQQRVIIDTTIQMLNSIQSS